MSIEQYDYIIVGAGPSGLTLAWCFAKLGKTVLIIDREKTIGGCHRVRRINNEIFTEHGPRIYNSNYLSTEMILRDMKIDPNEIFTPYLFNATSIAQDILGVLTKGEIFSFVVAFMTFIFNEESSKRKTVLEFAQENNFKENSIDLLDRICRLTDGAGVEKYTMFEFLQLLNQNAFYQILQPRNPTDLGLFSKWGQRLKDTGKVKFLLNTTVSGLEEESGKISALYINKSNNNEGWSFPQKITGKNYILAVPLTNIVNILERSNSMKIQNAFGSFRNFKNFANESEYITYIPITYQWNRQIEIPKLWGYPRQDWDVATIVLSDYMDLNGKTVISTCISAIDKPSSFTGKTANESTHEELIDETWRQIVESYGSLPKPELAIISPGIFRNESKDSWESQDKAFILTTQGFFKEQKSNIFSNLYNVGPHNGYSPYSFTAMESAIDNALYLLHTIYPVTKSCYPIHGPVTISGVMRIIFLLITILVSLYYVTR